MAAGTGMKQLLPVGLKSFYENTLERLTCPVCFEPMDSRIIMQCAQGHVLCELCDGKVTQCPQCRTKKGKVRIRCLPLEQIACALPEGNCMYSQQGCKATVAFVEKKKHETNCMYRDLPCMARTMSQRFAACQWTGPASKQVHHVKAAHTRHIGRSGLFDRTGCPLDLNEWKLLGQLLTHHLGGWTYIFEVLLPSSFSSEYPVFSPPPGEIGDSPSPKEEAKADCSSMQVVVRVESSTVEEEEKVMYIHLVACTLPKIAHRLRYHLKVAMVSERQPVACKPVPDRGVVPLPSFPLSAPDFWKCSLSPPWSASRDVDGGSCPCGVDIQFKGPVLALCDFLPRGERSDGIRVRLPTDVKEQMFAIAGKFTWLPEDHPPVTLSSFGPGSPNLPLPIIDVSRLKEADSPSTVVFHP